MRIGAGGQAQDLPITAHSCGVSVVFFVGLKKMKRKLCQIRNSAALGVVLDTGGIRRKLSAARKSDDISGEQGAPAAWKLVIARAARDSIGLELAVSTQKASRNSLSELLEMPPERAMIIILEGPCEGLGLLILSPEVLSALIEMQTVGHVVKAAPLPRRPTKTDAAMVADLVDAALIGFETMLDGNDDLAWAGQFRYGTFLEDARPLGLLLEDIPYRVMQSEVSLASGVKTGSILLALPACGKVTKPQAEVPNTAAATLVFKAAMSEQILGSDATLNGVLARVTLPLQAILNFRPGDPIALGTSALDRIDLEGVDGCRVAGGKLGQNRGMRAIRLMAEAAPAARIKGKNQRSGDATAPAPEAKATRAAG